MALMPLAISLKGAWIMGGISMALNLGSIPVAIVLGCLDEMELFWIVAAMEFAGSILAMILLWLALTP